MVREVSGTEPSRSRSEVCRRWSSLQPLQIVTTERIKIWKCRTIHLLFLSQYLSQSQWHVSCLSAIQGQRWRTRTRWRHQRHCIRCLVSTLRVSRWSSFERKQHEIQSYMCLSWCSVYAMALTLALICCIACTTRPARNSLTIAWSLCMTDSLCRCQRGRTSYS